MRPANMSWSSQKRIFWQKRSIQTAQMSYASGLNFNALNWGDDEMQSIKAKAFSLLARKSYFSKELRLKLLEKGYPLDQIQALFEELQSQGWLNDEELARRFVQRQRDKGYGARVITQKLKQKAGEIEVADLEATQEEVIDLIQKKYARFLPDQREKVIRSLLRRGFSYELINNSLKDINK